MINRIPTKSFQCYETHHLLKWNILFFSKNSMGDFRMSQGEINGIIALEQEIYEGEKTFGGNTAMRDYKFL